MPKHKDSGLLKKRKIGYIKTVKNNFMEKNMLFASTRDKSNKATYEEAIFKGLASDGGLFHPIARPNLTEIYKSFNSDSSFNDIAFQITWNLLKEELTEAEAKTLCDNAFNFEPKLHQLDENLSVLELFHGPSAAFKDYGASFLANSMENFLKERDDHAIILTATSGDTGSAVARAFYKKKNIDVVILYPSKRVSPLQEKQLTTLGKNIHALEIEGSFDDCQRMVKEAFQDSELNKKLNLTSANSINIGRLIPQSFYYTWAWSRYKTTIDKNPQNFITTIPSGNFGNLTAGLLAWKWGMNTGNFIAATNRNDVVPQYLQSGKYSPKASVQTPSNAMDVGAPSNFERMQAIFPTQKEMSQKIEGFSFSDEETLETMSKIKKEYNYFVCPHTAIGIKASQQFLERVENRDKKVVTFSTAHPAKFLEVVEEATGETPPLPESLKDVQDKQKIATLIENSLEALANELNKLFL